MIPAIEADDQDLKVITQSLVDHCRDTFDQLGSKNKFEVSPYRP